MATSHKEKPMSENKLSPHMTWVFAFGSIAAGIAISYALSGLGQKVTAGVYFALVALGGFASTYLTRAKIGSAIGTFLAGAAVAGVAYYLLVSYLFTTVTTVTTDVVSGGHAHAQGVDAGATMGHFFGVFIAAFVFLETAVGGIIGAVVGYKSRGKAGGAALASLARNVR
jgi:hypothetical protein